ncbi:MAG: exodeoxyribonuclease III [Candidatus Taylorbacteria bacterium CG11_big_fil_rev_8_21_14_0_20_46_11]|uniref:Exodeoxyribonuclease III n=1 Tax=Candidatus Taylorbacteria bacterium CG11_big_fil_rev_8_21_14_0_20_46_11 TaxID=1975025 RepID=A0A2H0KAS9_9BACT|nr:MAG: exodeoxyribonuclease III [Candidatus Taylorbacteria bacterium CG11_big_fil_rev_8_21_14_0_20_46_11]
MINMNIISWNVNGFRAWSKKGYFDWFLKQSPDFFCLQETKANPDQLEDEFVNPKGYIAYFDHSKGRKGYSGVAIYAKKEPEGVDYGIGVEELDQEGRFIALHYNDFVLCNIYFPNGGQGPSRLKYKMLYYEAFLRYIEKIRKTGKSVIFCGDVNTAHSPIDLARPKDNELNTGFLPVERAWVSKVIEKGYTDVFRHFNPEKEESYTYWDMKTRSRDRNIGWRIDYFFVSQDIISKVKKTEILSDVFGSDHCPILLEIDI